MKNIVNLSITLHVYKNAYICKKSNMSNSAFLVLSSYTGRAIPKDGHGKTVNSLLLLMSEVIEA